MTDGMKEPDRPGGLTLDEAWKTHVSRELRIRYLAAQVDCPPPYDDDFFEIEERNALYLDTPRYAGFFALEKAWLAVWHDLVAKLESGYLVGFVFDEYPINLNSRRRIVSAGMWSRAQNIGDDVVLGGARYSDLRIWLAADLEEPGGEPNAAGGRGAQAARRKKNWKVLVSIVAAETPAAAALLENANPANGAVRDAVAAMMEDPRMADAEAETVDREFRKIRPRRSKKKADS